jgi:hypothetical protein
MTDQQARTAAWLWSYSKGKKIQCFGGNFWGISRKRGTIIQPDLIDAMANAGLCIRCLGVELEPGVHDCAVFKMVKQP